MACYVYSKAEIASFMTTWPAEKVKEYAIDTKERAGRIQNDLERAFEAAAPEAYEAFIDERAERNADRADAEWQGAGWQDTRN